MTYYNVRGIAKLEVSQKKSKHSFVCVGSMGTFAALLFVSGS
jgi:hypothetical protein